jgi:hypothetical protein
MSIRQLSDGDKTVLLFVVKLLKRAEQEFEAVFEVENETLPFANLSRHLSEAICEGEDILKVNGIQV